MNQLSTNKLSHNQIKDRQYHWRFWANVPIYPYSKRRTIRQEILPNTIWTFDQLQGIFYVVVPIRMTVIRLDQGGLLVYAPVAPTQQCIDLVQELVAEHGEVKYIILPTISGLEHKYFVGPFARKFPQATVFVAPKQWSFPVNLPLSWLGFPPQRTQVLPTDSSQTPFADEFDYAILGDIDLRLGQFEEVAFFHKRSQTLLVTDSIVSIPNRPPEIIEQDLFPLLFHARENGREQITDTPENRLKGWQRICLFAMYFRSSVLDIPSLGKIFQDAWRSPNKSAQAYWGLFPFQWQPNWQDAFAQLRQDGRLLVAPILQTLILNRAPKETLAWADKVASWNFQRVISCHFTAPVAATSTEFRRAFNFLQADSLDKLPEADLATLKKIDAFLYKPGIVPPPQPLLSSR
ncbi:hypothetical protein C7B62_05370 [Pleurocapsa sp. CCALA 161]|uniref:DUF4336 domain-containing protein n=1 Tax=Pleurocapsa sp. CCALA 161 TaxID=2107688 RepID=UPI000D059A12|nr:DUF4336 domain-containing protein [Pleurocapsa sp. CCALA 161]PSB11484.1 hypothetical protein C7B62_05370 [Pleurocapsa sp. CCALA 161]